MISISSPKITKSKRPLLHRHKTKVALFSSNFPSFFRKDVANVASERFQLVSSIIAERFTWARLILLMLLPLVLFILFLLYLFSHPLSLGDPADCGGGFFSTNRLPLLEARQHSADTITTTFEQSIHWLTCSSLVTALNWGILTCAEASPAPPAAAAAIAEPPLVAVDATPVIGAGVNVSERTIRVGLVGHIGGGAGAVTSALHTGLRVALAAGQQFACMVDNGTFAAALPTPTGNATITASANASADTTSTTAAGAGAPATGGGGQGIEYGRRHFTTGPMHEFTCGFLEYNTTAGVMQRRPLEIIVIPLSYSLPYDVALGTLRASIAGLMAAPATELVAVVGAVGTQSPVVATVCREFSLPLIGSVPTARAPFVQAPRVYRDTNPAEVKAAVKAARAAGNAAFNPNVTTTTALLRRYQPYELPLVPSPDAELRAMLAYVVREYQPKRFAVVVSTRGPVASVAAARTAPLTIDGAALLEELQLALDRLGLTLVAVIRAPGGNANITSAQLATAAERGAQVIFQLAAATDAAVPTLIAAHFNNSNVIVCMPFFGIYANGAIRRMHQTTVIASSIGPLIRDEAAPVTRRFFEDFERAVRLDPTLNATRAAALSSDIGVLTLFAYLTGRLLTDIVRRVSPAPITAASILNETFSGRVFAFEEVVYGPVSPPCVGQQRSSTCGCTSGARAVYLGTFDGPGGPYVPLPGGTLRVAAEECSPTSVTLQGPLVQLVAVPNAASFVAGALAAANGTEALAAMAAASEEFVAGDRAGYSAGEGGAATPTTLHRTGILVYLKYNVSDAAAALAVVQRDRLVTVSTGSAYAAREMVGGEGGAENVTAVIDPLQGVPAVNGRAFSARVVHLSATLDQEVYYLSQAFEDREPVSVVAGSGDTDATEGLVEVVRLSAHTTGREPGSVLLATNVAAGLAAAPVAAGTTMLVHGIAGVADIAAIAAYLARAGPQADVMIMLPFLHVRVWYAQLLQHVTAPGDRARVVFATSLPSWNPSATRQRASTLLREYHAGLAGLRAPSPQSLLGFVTQRFLAALAERNPVALSERVLLQTLYEVSVVVVDALVFGPFVSDACRSEGRSDSCAINIGPRTVNVYTLDAVTTSDPNTSTAPLFSRGSSRSPFPRYRSLREPPEADRTLLYALVGAGGTLVLVVAAFAAILVKTMRNTVSAPKDKDVPFTIVFTDIQSSTALWAEAPDEMAAAVEHHHMLIRRLIAKHSGYEVKTIGDAFMIAFKHADDAVRLARDLQHDFYASDAFADTIDGAYLAFDHERLQLEGGGGRTVNADLINLSINLPPDVYARLWHGLRVRVGIHTGFGDIQKDPVTGGYDYYGTVVNTAARVEAAAHGGQILVTEAVLEALQTLEVHRHGAHFSARLPSAVSAMLPPSTRPASSEEQRPEKNPMALSAPATGDVADDALCEFYCGSLLHVISLGPTELRGLGAPMTLLQVEAFPPGRRFPPPRGGEMLTGGAGASIQFDNESGANEDTDKHLLDDDLRSRGSCSSRDAASGVVRWGGRGGQGGGSWTDIEQLLDSLFGATTGRSMPLRSGGSVLASGGTGRVYSFSNSGQAMSSLTDHADLAASHGGTQRLHSPQMRPQPLEGQPPAPRPFDGNGRALDIGCTMGNSMVLSASPSPSMCSRSASQSPVALTLSVTAPVAALNIPQQGPGLASRETQNANAITTATTGSFQRPPLDSGNVHRVPPAAQLDELRRLLRVKMTTSVSPQQTMAVLMAAFAVLPGPARRKELKALCDRWRLQVDTAAATTTAKVTATVTSNNNSGSDKSHSGSTNATNESGHGTAKVAAGLSRGDVVAAAMLEPLGRRLAGIAQRTLQQQLLSTPSHTTKAGAIKTNGVRTSPRAEVVHSRPTGSSSASSLQKNL